MLAVKLQSLHRVDNIISLCMLVLIPFSRSLILLGVLSVITDMILDCSRQEAMIQ